MSRRSLGKGVLITIKIQGIFFERLWEFPCDTHRGGKILPLLIHTMHLGEVRDRIKNMMGDGKEEPGKEEVDTVRTETVVSKS